VWIATALLRREQPDAADFTVKEIVDRVAREMGDTRAAVYVHASSHCVANRTPQGGRYRMLFETAPSRRRLFRPGDRYDPRREGGKCVPNRDEIPAKYHGLLDSYELERIGNSTKDPLLTLAARHRDIWRAVDADAYVRRLREGFR